jgi:hypothetical protein
MRSRWLPATASNGTDRPGHAPPRPGDERLAQPSLISYRSIEKKEKRRRRRDGWRVQVTTGPQPCPDSVARRGNGGCAADICFAGRPFRTPRAFSERAYDNSAVYRRQSSSIVFSGGEHTGCAACCDPGRRSLTEVPDAFRRPLDLHLSRMDPGCPIRSHHAPFDCFGWCVRCRSRRRSHPQRRGTFLLLDPHSTRRSAGGGAVTAAAATAAVALEGPPVCSFASAQHSCQRAL